MQDIDEYISLLIGKSKRRIAIDFMGELITEYPNIAELRNRLAELYIQDGQILEAVGPARRHSRRVIECK